MALKLSILIATMPSRKAKFLSLMARLGRQIDSRVEIISDPSMEYNIGVKRNKLLERAQGEYVVFIDDDDKISSNYIRKILAAIGNGSDCIGISGVITTNGRKQMQWHISKDYGSWHQKDRVYYRTPNHISPVKRELALQVRFPEVRFGEDYDYSMRLLPLLQTETKVQGNIYHYDYNSK